MELTTELTFTLENLTVAKYPEKEGHFLSDGFRKNEMTGAVEFYSSGELVAAVEAEWYVIDITDRKTK